MSRVRPKARRAGKNRSQWSANGLSVLLIPLFLLFSCGGDSGTDPTPIDQQPSAASDEDRESVEKLVEVYLPKVYEQLDFDRYTECLDNSYRFEALLDESSEADTLEWWPLELERVITERMFSGAIGSEGEPVRAISLEITLKTQFETTTNFPDQPDGEAWFEVLTSVKLNVFMEGGLDPTTYQVISPQIFVVRPDRDLPGLWAIYRQTDRPASGS